MKPSMYNNFVEYENKIVGYNALKNTFIILDKALYELYEEIVVRNRNIDKLQEIHLDFYEFILEKGFIVDKEKDEFLEVENLQKEIDGRDDTFELFINPTMNCNFKCWYCYETHIKGSKMSKETIQNVVKLVENIITSNQSLKYFYLSWFGGEPLLQYKNVVKPLLKTVKGLCDKKNIQFNSGFTTNGLLINQDMINVFKEYNVNQFQITLDGTKNLHNKIRYISQKRGSYDEIVKNIILLVKNQIRVSVRVNCTQETLNDIGSIMNEFSKLTLQDREYISFSLHKVWQTEDQIDEDISKYINMYNGTVFFVDGVSLDSFRDSCYADKKNHALVNYNGDVFKCTARDFLSKNREGVLLDGGRIQWNEKSEERMSIKLKNPPCKNCSVLPLCGGGCSQVALENKDKSYCLYDFDENKKKKLVLDTFISRISV